MKKSPLESFSYRMISRCPMCSASAHNAHIELLDESADGNMLMYARCGSCKIGLLATLSTSQHGMQGAAIMTDLHKNEIEQFADTDPISADEVMNHVRWLRT